MIDRITEQPFCQTRVSGSGFSAFRSPKFNKKKMKYKIHYAKLDLQGDIPCLEFKNWKERMLFVCDKVTGSMGIVFLLAINYNASRDIDSVYVFDNWNCVRFLSEQKYNSSHYTFYLQEYQSYEEAYKVALDMKEVSCCATRLSLTANVLGIAEGGALNHQS